MLTSLHAPFTLLIAFDQGANPVSVTVTLRGKKYDVKDATSVEDVQKSVEEQAGLAKEQQVCSSTWRVLICCVGFKNTRRHSRTCLRDGVEVHTRQRINLPTRFVQS